MEVSKYVLTFTFIPGDYYERCLLLLLCEILMKKWVLFRPLKVFLFHLLKVFCFRLLKIFLFLPMRVFLFLRELSVSRLVEVVATTGGGGEQKRGEEEADD